MRKGPPKYIANFDSASAMVRSIARYLKGKDFPTVGLPMAPDSLMQMANQLPEKGREIQYTIGGWGEAISPNDLDSVKADRVAEWITGLYPTDRRYPAAFIGSSSGALTHLAAALGVPWLPQTFLIPVSQMGVHPDDAKEGMEAAIEPARKLLDANPELQLHHMHDPNQDRLMLHLMTYFRVKWLRMAQAYKDFLEENLEPGGTLFIVECQRSWPTTQVGERHIFQMGALGGATPEEFLDGSDRVRDYLRRYESHREQWDPPRPDGERPEAEWGFEAAMRGDIESFARERGYRIVRLVFQEPEHLSPLVADLYRWWYRRRNLRANRLLVESFILHEPWWTLQTGSVPFWLKFGMEPSARWLEQYLDESEPYDFIHMMLFSHGVECVGLEPIEGWRRKLDRARKEGRFVGVDEAEFPRDFATFSRYHQKLKEIPSRYGIPGSIGMTALEDFLREAGDRYPVQWVEEGVAVGA